MAKGDLAKTGKLVVTVAAVAVDPTGLAAAGAGLDAYLHAHEKLSDRHPDLDKLARETQAAFEAALKTRAYDKPDGARQLLPQMLESALPGRTDFVDHGLDPGPILDAMAARLSDPEHTRPEMVTAFRTLYGPLLEQVCNDPRLKTALGPALTRDRVRREYRREGKLNEVLARLDGLEGAVANPDAASFDDLLAIASQFDEIGFDSKAQVTEFLGKKAEEYRAYRDQIEAIDGRVAGLGNLKAAARDAAEKLDFEEVEALLSRVHEVEIEIAAETAELRARNALLRGRVEQSYSLIIGAADSFSVVDTLEPVKKKILKYAEFFGRHGMRFGGQGLALSVRLMRDVADEDLKASEPWLWAAAKNAEAIGLRNQGTRTAGPEGADLLGEAVAAYRDALTVRTREDHPVDWAVTSKNLALAEEALADHEATADPAPHLKKALGHVEDALTVFDPEHLTYEYESATGIRDRLRARLDGG